MVNFKSLGRCFFALALFALPACGGATSAMVPDREAVFAKGEVSVNSVSDDGNGSYVVKVDHLGDPAKLNSSATVYVVWVMPKGKEDANIQNMGAIKVDSDYSGEHAFNTTFKAFEVTITPEPSADVTKPSGRDVLKTNVAVD